MTDTTYATLAEFKERLSIADSTSNTLLQNILNSGASLFDQNTRKPPRGNEAFSEGASATRYFDDHVRQDGILEIDDLQSISALTRSGQTITNANYYLFPYNISGGYEPWTRIYLLVSSLAFPYLYQVSQVGGLAYNYPLPNTGVKQIAVTGTWGFCGAAKRPPEIKEATLRQAIAMWEWQNLSRGERINMITNPYKELDPVVEQIACQFRRTGEGWF